jgi:hypothetical protein
MERISELGATLAVLTVATRRHVPQDGNLRFLEEFQMSLSGASPGSGKPEDGVRLEGRAARKGRSAPYCEL